MTAPHSFIHSSPALDTARWARLLRDIAEECMDCPPDDQRHVLRQAAKLLRRGPAGEDFGVLSPADFEAMIRIGAFESAAISLLGPGSGYLLSRGPNGIHLASVFLPGSDVEVTAEAPSAALALVAALALSLAAPPGALN